MDRRRVGAGPTALASLPPAELPRYQSERSGDVFAKLTSTESLKLLTDDQLPIQARGQFVLLEINGCATTMKTYLNAYLGGQVGGAEMVELFGAQLRTIVACFDFYDAFRATLDPGDPTYQVRLQGYDQMRSGVSTVLAGASTTLTERSAYRREDLLRLVDYLREVLPVVLPRLAPNTQAEIVKRLINLQNNPALADLQPGLRKLLVEVQTAFSASQKKAAVARGVAESSPPRHQADAPPPDASLEVAQYVELGLPAIDHPWSVEEYSQAAGALQTVAKEGLQRLPRYQSPRSGDVFTRLVATDLIGTLTNERSAPLERSLHAMPFIKAASGIQKLYVAALAEHAVGGVEVVELMHSKLDYGLLMVELSEGVVRELPPDDPTYQVRVDALEQLKGGTVGWVGEALKIIALPEKYGRADRARMLNYAECSLPSLFVKMPLDKQVNCRDLSTWPNTSQHSRTCGRACSRSLRS